MKCLCLILLVFLTSVTCYRVLPLTIIDEELASTKSVEIITSTESIDKLAPVEDVERLASTESIEKIVSTESTKKLAFTEAPEIIASIAESLEKFEPTKSVESKAPTETFEKIAPTAETLENIAPTAESLGKIAPIEDFERKEIPVTTALNDSPTVPTTVVTESAPVTDIFTNAPINETTLIPIIPELDELTTESVTKDDSVKDEVITEASDVTRNAKVLESAIDSVTIEPKVESSTNPVIIENNPAIIENNPVIIETLAKDVTESVKEVAVTASPTAFVEPTTTELYIDREEELRLLLSPTLVPPKTEYKKYEPDPRYDY